MAAQGRARGPKAGRAQPPNTAQFSPVSFATDSPERLNAAVRAQSSGSKRRRAQPEAAPGGGARGLMSACKTATTLQAQVAATQISVLGLHLLSWPGSCGGSCTCVWHPTLGCLPFSLMLGSSPGSLVRQ